MTDSNGGLAPHPNGADSRDQIAAERRVDRHAHLPAAAPWDPQQLLLGPEAHETGEAPAGLRADAALRANARGPASGAGWRRQRPAPCHRGRRTRRGHRDRGPRRTRRWHLRRYLRDASLEDQIANLFTHMGVMLEEAGAGWKDMAKITFFVGDGAARAALNDPWLERFPRRRLAPSPPHPGGGHGGPREGLVRVHCLRRGRVISRRKS